MTDRWLALAFFGTALGLRILYAWHFRVDSDEPQHLHVIWAWTRGLLPYRDVFDNHTPVFQALCAPLFQALGVRADILLPMRLAMLPLFALTIWCVWKCARTLFAPRAALWTAVFAAFYQPFFFTSLEFRPDELWTLAWLLTLTVLVTGRLTTARLITAGPVLLWLADVSDRWLRLPALALPALRAVVEIVCIVRAKSPLTDQTTDKIGMVADTLKLTDPDDFVIASKGEPIYRRRSFYYVFEGLTKRRLDRGLFTNDIAQRLLTLRQYQTRPSHQSGLIPHGRSLCWLDDSPKTTSRFTMRTRKLMQGLQTAGGLRFALLSLCSQLLLTSFTSAAVQLPEDSAACVRWAGSRVERVLKDHGVSPNSAEIVVQKEDETNRSAESFSLRIEGQTLVVSGSDANGRMYGLLELAEQIENSPSGNEWDRIVPTLVPKKESPFVAFRADNPFIRIDRKGAAKFAEYTHLIDPPLLFEDVAMWKSYIDMLAVNRFNVLDLHGGYNLATTTFFNLLPLLVSVPAYHGVGNPRSQQRNLKDLTEIITYAADRGVSVALMNYSAEADGVSAEALGDYTRHAVCALLKALPQLKEFGFRVGESGQDAAFFKATYVGGLQDSGRHDVRLYTRNWRTTPEALNTIAAAVGGALDVEIKYNGEHLGLPYQAMQGPAHSRYSYEDFLTSQAQYQPLWQVRANGTHRFWTWAQTEFIRRAVRSFRFGGARGFSLEPQFAYFNTNAATYYRAKTEQGVYRYVWEKNWPWYFAWGRLSYNPDLAAETLVAAFSRRFGPAGKAVYEALQASGDIVPMALAYRFTGPDQRNMSPETQTSAFDPVKHEAITPLSFALNTPMDSRSFVGIDGFVENKIAGRVDGRVDPPRMAQLFSRAAVRTRELVSSVRGLSGRQAAEWNLLKVDLLSASWLGEYYGERVIGTMHLDYALKTGSTPDYDAAIEHLTKSRLAWKRLAETADSVYAPINDPLIGQSDFTWGSQNEPIRKLDSTIPSLWSKCHVEPSAKPLSSLEGEQSGEWAVQVTDVAHVIQAGGSVAISCRVLPPIEAVQLILWTKDLPSQSKWVSRMMTSGVDGRFSATLPKPSEGMLYLVELRDSTGRALQFPPVLQTTPYWTITASELSAHDTAAKPKGE